MCTSCFHCSLERFCYAMCSLYPISLLLKQRGSHMSESICIVQIFWILGQSIIYKCAFHLSCECNWQIFRIYVCRLNYDLMTFLLKICGCMSAKLILMILSTRAAYKGYADTVRLLLFRDASQERQDREGINGKLRIPFCPFFYFISCNYQVLIPFKVYMRRDFEFM